MVCKVVMFSFTGNALTDEGFKAIIDIIISGALPNLIYINVDGIETTLL